MAVLYREPAGVRRAAASVGGNGVLRLRPAPGRKQRMGMGIVCLRIGNMCEGKADGEEMRVISRLRRVTEFTKLHCLSRPIRITMLPSYVSCSVSFISGTSSFFSTSTIPRSDILSSGMTGRASVTMRSSGFS